MKIVRIPHVDVEAHPEYYNSSFHREDEAVGHVVPTEGPQRYGRWLPLIAQSQGINPNRIQKIVLRKRQGELLFAASNSTIHTHILNRVYVDELTDEILPSFKRLNFPPEGLFLRFDACSPKDGVGGTKPLVSADEIVLRITSSIRARNAIDAILGRMKKTDEQLGINLFFIPFNDKMNTALEYRVFCPRTEIGQESKISVVSQYKWHRPSIFQQHFSKEEVDLVLVRIMKEIQRIHLEILDELKEDEMDVLLLKQGFSFDIMYDEESNKCSLIELNGFGARSGCGGCLFHWIRDMDAMYGIREVEFRISEE